MVSLPLTPDGQRLAVDGDGAAGGAGDLVSSGEVVVIRRAVGGPERGVELLRRVEDLVCANLALLERLDLKDVVVIGNSIGGWIAAELALRHSPRIRSIILIDAVGIDPGAGNPAIVNPMSVPPAERSAMSMAAL